MTKGEKPKWQKGLGRYTTLVISSAVEKSNCIARSTPFCPSLTLRDFSALVEMTKAPGFLRVGRNDKRRKAEMTKGEKPK